MSDGRDARGAAVIEALAAQPGGGELLALAAERDDLALVGGAVRDLLTGRRPRELDVTVARDAAGLAAQLAARLPQGEATVHERFGTAAVRSAGGAVDIAARRAESYPRPGALPEVRAGSVGEDLARRDFSVNAMAVPLGGPRRGELDAVEPALEDLARRRLRVLHDASFTDDPTRLLRLARYAARLGYEIEPHTAELARAALAGGALGTVSGARIGAELLLAAGEDEPLAALAALGELGVLEVLDLPPRYDRELAAQALELLPDEALPAIPLAVLVRSPERDSEAGRDTPAPAPGAASRAPEPAARAATAKLLDDLAVHAELRERVLSAAFDAAALAAALADAERPSELHRLLAGKPLETVALAAALAGAGAQAHERAKDWIDRLRHVKLEIDGADLMRAGIAEGPDVGRRLRRALDAKLDGELDGDGAQAELRAALA